MTLVNTKTAQTREKRLNAVNAYLGHSCALAQEFRAGRVEQRIRTFSQSCEDEIIYALRLLNGITNAVTVVHGPQGCAAAELFLQGRKGGSGQWGVTNLSERDTIMGADRTLRQAVMAIHRRHRPEAIFVVATPVVAINNDDIQSVANELSGELGIPILPIHTDGFKSRHAVTGFDVALHAVVKHLVPRGATAKGGHINLISVAENRRGLAEAQRLLEELGVEVNTLPDGATTESFAKAASAKFSLSLNPDYGDYLGRVLETEHQVPFLRQRPPIGLEATQEWLEAVGEALGLQEKAREVAEREREGLLSLLESRPLKEVRVYVDLPTATALGVADLVEELGGEVVGLTVEHFDSLHQQELRGHSAKRPGLKVHAAQGQPFESANILSRIRPDLYVGGFGRQVGAAKGGIAAVSIGASLISGFRGIASFARQAEKALKNGAFVAALAEAGRLPYQKGWLLKSSNWHIKQEVR